MKITVILMLSGFLFAGAAQAKEKDRTFAQPCTVVFPIAEKMASEKPYKLQLDGRTDMNLIIETGSFWKAGAAQIIVRFSANSDGTCSVADSSPYSGVRRNGTVFLDRLEKRLAEAGPAK